MAHSTKRTVLLVAAIGLAAFHERLRAEDELEQRWVYLAMNLQVADNVPKATDVIRRAAAAGYNGVVLADYKLNILDRVPDHYRAHAEQVKRLCAELRMELIPTVAPIGYSDGLLAHNPNLAEGLPVRDAPFVVRDGAAVLAARPDPLIPGGGFERSDGDAVEGWDMQDGPGSLSFADAHARHSGGRALRWERKEPGDYQNARVAKAFRVAPRRQFHASVWIKTAGFEAAQDVRLFAMGADGRVLSHANLGVQRDQDWTEHHVVFNSLDNETVRLYCGTWGLRGGRLWMDDVACEETALVNLVRRTGCPLRIQTSDNRDLVEGRDFAELSDPKMGRVPYEGSFDVYHEPPAIRILPGSRIENGAALRVSFFHTLTIYDQQVCCCLAEPDVFRIIEEQVRNVERLFGPRWYFLSHDEIRVANWCDACRRDGRSAGHLLADNVRQCVAAIRRVNPTARLCVWSDMFDPNHNASAAPFYLVNGDLTGSWEGLPRDMWIINWNSGKAAASLSWFRDRGHAQVLAGYYDADPARITDWLDVARRERAGAAGVMYTTWRQDYSNIEAFAGHAWGPNK